ncbi:hypothetical protein [Pedobacter agri]|uniref:hypothetical protein n=1 Tax=Pedobacter agri TaxID=454586 RepID=UPI00278B139A|nr:hypothetical protein [Pedobacter agri]MDQ1142755.1 hypothetical protein [Pedobacter agri]
MKRIMMIFAICIGMCMMACGSADGGAGKENKDKTMAGASDGSTSTQTPNGNNKPNDSTGTSSPGGSK